MNAYAALAGVHQTSARPLSLTLSDVQPGHRSSTFVLPRVSVVIPTLNEAKNLPWLLPRIPEWVHEVIFVDGCSKDDTIDVALSYLPDARIVTEHRRGKGAALAAGFAAASGDIVVTFDADGSMAPEEIIFFVGALMAGADFAKGSRFLQGAGTDDMSLYRKLGNWGLNKAVWAFYGASFSDLCYGYVAFWRRHLPLFRSDCDGFEIETLLNVRAIKNRLKIVEVASFEAPRISGRSNLRPIRDGWRILRAIIREWHSNRVRIVAHGCP
jgi:glycosyltransferase involved in cell wall biosynthesis